MSIDVARFRKRFRSLAAELGRSGTASLCEVLEEERFAPGDVVVDLAGTDWRLHLLEEGTVSVRLPGPTGLVEVGELHAGSVLGEVSFLDHELHTAEVVAEVPCVCQRLSHAGMEVLRRRDPAAATNLVHAACAVLAERLRMAVSQIEALRNPDNPLGAQAQDGEGLLMDAVRVLFGMPRKESELSSTLALLPGFAELTPHERSVLDHAMWTQERPDGHAFISQGTRTDTAYLVLSGQVAVRRKTREGTMELARMNPGELFGVLALLDHQPRSASCVAVGNTRVACLQRQAYDALRHRPTVLRPVQQAIAAQLTRDVRNVEAQLREELSTLMS